MGEHLTSLQVTCLEQFEIRDEVECFSLLLEYSSDFLSALQQNTVKASLFVF